MRQYFIGIDGGGSGVRARLADTTGRVHGEAAAGPANIGNDFEGAVAAIEAVTIKVLSAAGLSDDDRTGAVVVIGAAGAGDSNQAQRLVGAVRFGRLRVVTDAEIALEGAFSGGDGGILIVGTGSQAYARLGERRFRVGGWGAALSDGGSGAVLGRRAARRALEALEGLAAPSDMTAALLERLGGTAPALSAFGKAAKPADWAGLARLVFAHAEAGDPVAAAIVQAGTAEIEAMIGRLVVEGVERVALMGGLATSYRPRVAPVFASLLADPMGDALDGALGLARKEAGA